ncbi:hypothetical protein [Alteromonas sp. a30]|uniref:hypothetical protein n=1 Tax=Alteromonas sp. a30 TaxID=2730917 RepID=UPI002282A1BB|nr:hypothetical protein [Alteromonas sp. a30]MCY7294373.1 hypothetical protein [Alteromonas sp. a30]
MLKKLNPSQAVLIGFITLLLIEFVVNVLIDESNSGRSLSTDSWDKTILAQQKSADLSPLNALFGLRSEAEIEQERLAEEQARAAEQLAQKQKENEKKKRDDVLVFGKDNVRLFGISVNGDEKLAIISVKNTSKEDKLLKIRQGDSLALQDGKVNLTLDNVLSDSIQVSVINNIEEKSSFNLVIFNYGI